MKIATRWVAGAAVLALGLSACGGGSDVDDSVTGSVLVDGSSTVYPMSVTAQELLAEEAPGVSVAIGSPPAGSGGGFEKFCSGQIDVSDASRPIKDEEAATCADNGIEFTELLVATDALTVVVNKDLAVECLTTDQLVTLFGPNDKPTNWNQIDPSFPDQRISGFIPGTDSGTYDYMAADVIDDESGVLRDDFETSEDDNVLVQGVENTAGGVGFFGYTYYEESGDSLKAVSIDSGNGCVAPSADTAQSGEYTPLARPLFIYVDNAKYSDNEAVSTFVDFYIDNLVEIAEAAQFIPLNDDDYSATKDALAGITS